jgi:L-lactate dehydrogenase complex protein LldF
MTTEPVTSHHDPSALPIHERVQQALADEQLRQNLGRFQNRWREGRAAVLPDDEFHSLRERLRAAKDEVIAEMPRYIAQFRANAEANGATVVEARTAEDAAHYVLELAQARGVKLLVKSKSMVSEEVALNQLLEANGVRAVETDLGEWIIQLAHERPSHMVAPAIHKSRQQVGDLFSAVLNREVPRDDISAQIKVARGELREEFLAAGMGMNGANALIAETGTVMIITNEGNGRLCATAPDIHIIIAGYEKLLPGFEDAVTQLRLLPRSAAGQWLTSYTTFMSGPGDGQEMHIILVDNGRMQMRSEPEFVDALRCIRCAACANVCPPYQVVGGHVFGHIYTGAIGLVNTSFHHGLDAIAGPQSLCVSCNACETVCPVGIPLPRQILDVRTKVVEAKGLPPAKAVPLGVLARPRLFDLAMRAGELLSGPVSRTGTSATGYAQRYVNKLPGVERLTSWRSLPVPAARPFRDRFHATGVGQPLIPNAAAGMTVAYFPGCITDRLSPHTGEAAVAVLRALGVRVAFPRGQNCCGLPAMNSGDRRDALTMAKQTSRVLERTKARYIVSTSTSCAAAMMDDYLHLFRDDPPWRARAERLRERIITFTHFLDRVARLGLDGPVPLPETGTPRPVVTYHDACQSCNVLGLREEPRRIIRDVLGLELREMGESSVCCGFGGSFSLEHPEVSSHILGRKLANAEGSAADVIVMDNPGCLMHIRGGLDAQGSNLRAVHLAELMAERLLVGLPAETFHTKR